MRRFYHAMLGVEVVLVVLGAFVVSFTLCVAVGAPLAARAARVHTWRKTAAPVVASERQFFERQRFEPVDFGPVTMRWPSEVQRESHAIPERPWPSAGWDDPHFGREARELAARTASAQAPSSGVRRPDSAPEPKKVTKRKPKKKAKRAPAPAPQVAERPAPAPPSGDSLPDRQQLEAMIDEFGLAGAVQQLMRSQGWDFKTAAGWLGRMRR